MNFEKAKIESREKETRLRERVELKNGKPYKKTNYLYNESKQLVSEQTEYGESKNKSAQEYQYDQQGRLIKRYSFFELRGTGGGKIEHRGELELVYDGESANPAMESYSRDGNVIELRENEYDDRGRLVKRKILSFGSGGESEREETFAYDFESRLAAMQEKSSERPEIFWRSNTYDAWGRIAREDRGFVGSGPIGSIDFEYEDDGKTVIQTNRYGSKMAKVWKGVEKRDEAGNLVELEYTAFEGGKIKNKSKSTFENRYE